MVARTAVFYCCNFFPLVSLAMIFTSFTVFTQKSDDKVIFHKIDTSL